VSLGGTRVPGSHTATEKSPISRLKDSVPQASHAAITIATSVCPVFDPISVLECSVDNSYDSARVNSSRLSSLPSHVITFPRLDTYGCRSSRDSLFVWNAR